MITHAEMSFIETRKMVQLTGAEMGHRISNTRSKIIAQGVINGMDRKQYQRENFYDEDNYRSTVFSDPVGELVVRRVMAVLNGLEPEPI